MNGHALFNTLRRTRTMAGRYIPSETQLIRALDNLREEVEPHLSENTVPRDITVRLSYELEMVASYIRVIHNSREWPVPAPAVLSISELIDQDLRLMESEMA